MLKIFLSSTYRDLAEYRSKILETLNTAFKGVGMEQFIPDGTNSQEVCISNLKKNDIVIFLISSYYGSLMKSCSLKEDCKAECPMKTGEYQISYTHCEYKTTVAEGILHQTYLIEKDWDNIPAEIKKQALEFKKEIGEEYLGIIDIEDKDLIKLICSNLATNIIEWHTDGKLNFKKFVDREDLLKRIIEGEFEIYGVGAIGKTALIQVALLLLKLKGRMIMSIGTSKAFARGSGLKYFRKKCLNAQTETESQEKITLHDIINALEKLDEQGEIKLNFFPEEIRKKPKTKIKNTLYEILRIEKNLTLFIDDFHLATQDLKELVGKLDNIILASRKKIYSSEKPIQQIKGIPKKNRDDLIDLYKTEEIPEKVRIKIKEIAEGHPLTTELLVKNYQNINFDKLEHFNLKDANDDQVREFYNRVIEEIFSKNAQVLELLKNLAVLNIELETNIDREAVNQAYDKYNPKNSFKELVDTGMLKKKKGKEGTYEFCYIHIKDALDNMANQKNHKIAIKYYEKKKGILEGNISDNVEILYHKVKSRPKNILVDEFLKLKYKVLPVHYGFKRFISIGEKLVGLVNKKLKAPIQDTLGNFYLVNGRYEEAEDAYQNALEIYLEFDKKDHISFKPNIAILQVSLGRLYIQLGKFEEAEASLLQALMISRDLAEENPKTYNVDLAANYNYLGLIFRATRKYEEAESTFKKAIETYKEILDKDTDWYKSNLAGIKNNLGLLYSDLKSFAKANRMYIEAIKIFQELAENNPDEFKPELATLQNNLGVHYSELEMLEEAEDSFLKALKTRFWLAERNPEVFKPHVAGTQNNLGILYRKLNRLEDAAKMYENALKVYKELTKKTPIAYNPYLATTLKNLGVLYLKLGKIEESKSASLKALEIWRKLAEKNPAAYKPDVAIIYNNIGNLYRNLKMFKEAESAFKEAVDYNPRDGFLWYNKARFESLRNMKDKAIESLKKAIELSEEIKLRARTVEEFENIRNLKKFKKLIGE